MLKPFTDLLKSLATPLTTALFFIVGITGLMMFFHVGPHSVNRAHEWLGVIFVLAALLHVFKNLKSLQNILTRKTVWLALIIALTVAVILAVLPDEEKEERAERRRTGEGSPAAEVAPAPQNPAAIPSAK